MPSFEPSSGEIFVTLLLGKTLVRPFYQRYVDSLDIQGGEKMFDFGSGSGVCSRFLAERLAGGGRLTCFDVSSRWQETARKTLAAFDNVDYVLGRKNLLALQPGSFDALFIHYVIHDIPLEERARDIQHLAQLLRPGGKAYIKEPCGRGGLPEVEIRLMFTRQGMHEIRQTVEKSWMTGKTYAGVFQKK